MAFNRVKPTTRRYISGAISVFSLRPGFLVPLCVILGWTTLENTGFNEIFTKKLARNMISPDHKKIPKSALLASESMK